AGLLPIEGVDAHQLAELEEVRDPARPFELLVQPLPVTDDPDIAPERLAQLANRVDAPVEAVGAARDAAQVGQDLAELGVEAVGTAAAVGAEQPRGPVGDV